MGCNACFNFSKFNEFNRGKGALMASIGYHHNYIKIIMMCNRVSNFNWYQMPSWLIFGFLVGPHSRHKLQYVNID